MHCIQMQERINRIRLEFKVNYDGEQPTVSAVLIESDWNLKITCSTPIAARTCINRIRLEFKGNNA